MTTRLRHIGAAIMGILDPIPSTVPSPMTEEEGAWVCAHAWTKGLRKIEDAYPRGFHRWCSCERGICPGCASGHHDRCVSAGGPRIDEHADTVTDAQGFVVAVIRYGPGQQPCRWLCPCPHPADVDETADTGKPAKPPAAQHAVPAHGPAATPEGQAPLFASGPQERGDGARHREVPGPGGPAVRGSAGGTDRVALVPAMARTEALLGACPRRRLRRPPLHRGCHPRRGARQGVRARTPLLRLVPGGDGAVRPVRRRRQRAAALRGGCVRSAGEPTAVLTKPLPELRPYPESLVCSRFVLLDQCPANSESWFLANCLKRLLASGVHGVVSFADPVPRRTASGVLVMPGHVGTIYAATNAVYASRATARTMKLLPDGTVFHSGVRAGSRRALDDREAASQQVDHGIGPP